MPAAFRPEENSLCFGRTIKSSLGFAHPSSNMWSASNILLQQIQENHITLSVFSPPCREGCGCESGAWWRKIDYPDKGTTRRARLQYVLRFVTNSKIIWQNAKQREQPGIREINWKEKMILILMMRTRQKMNAPISRFNKRLSRGRGGFSGYIFVKRGKGPILQKVISLLIIHSHKSIFFLNFYITLWPSRCCPLFSIPNAQWSRC